MEKTDVIIIGAGVVGLAIARKLSNFYEVIILEKNKFSGDETTSRNSGVIHGGMYYPENSYKAKLCVQGNKELYDYASRKKIPFKRCGKLILAFSKEDHEKLKFIYKQGKANGVDLDLISAEDAKFIEPEVDCYSAIYSKNTGILDTPNFINALEGDIQHNGGYLSLNSEFINAKKTNDGFEVLIKSDEIFKMKTKILINCSGLHSDKVSHSIMGLDAKYVHKIFYGKGHYFKYSGKNPFNSLVYPMPHPGSLGIHVGMDMSGSLRFGPDMTWEKTISYNFNDSLKNKFVSSIKDYWKNLDESKLHPDYTGIRPKISLDSSSFFDFSILTPKEHGCDGLYNLQGIESPGLTSSLAIGNFILKDINPT
jgi:L-2-hydroxyglutarate oxidase LhgO